MEILAFDDEDIQCVSAKEGINIKELFEKIVQFIPPPEGDENAPLSALIFDMKYDVYKGIIIYVRIMNGTLKQG